MFLSLADCLSETHFNLRICQLYTSWVDLIIAFTTLLLTLCNDLNGCGATDRKLVRVLVTTTSACHQICVRSESQNIFRQRLFWAYRDQAVFQHYFSFICLTNIPTDTSGIYLSHYYIETTLWWSRFDVIIMLHHVSTEMYARITNQMSSIPRFSFVFLDCHNAGISRLFLTGVIAV